MYTKLWLNMNWVKFNCEIQTLETNLIDLKVWTLEIVRFAFIFALIFIYVCPKALFQF